MRKSDRSIESFVGIIISEADLEFNCLEELSLLSGSQELVDCLLEEISVDLTHGFKIFN